MMLVVWRDPHGTVLANREDLRKYFRKEIWERLPEGDNVYAFGDWTAFGVGCPLIQTQFMYVENFREEIQRWDKACNELVWEWVKAGKDQPEPTTVPIPTPEREPQEVGT